MNTMDDMVMTIKHLTMLLEDARKENQELRTELNQVKGLLWMKEAKKLSDEDVCRLIKEIQKTSITVATGTVKGSDRYGYDPYNVLTRRGEE